MVALLYFVWVKLGHIAITMMKIVFTPDDFISKQ